MGFCFGGENDVGLSVDADTVVCSLDIDSEADEECPKGQNHNDCRGDEKALERGRSGGGLRAGLGLCRRISLWGRIRVCGESRLGGTCMH